MLGFQFARNDGGTDVYAPAASAVTGQLPIALQTTLVAATTALQSALAVLVPTAAVAVQLPQTAPIGSPILVVNTAASAVAVTVFPPWNYTTAAAAGGKIFGAAAGAPTANAGVSVAQGRSVLFSPHPNGIDWTALWGAVA